MKNINFKSILITAVIGFCLLLSLPSFLTIIGLFFIPLSVFNQMFMYPFFFGLMFWPSLVASSDVSFVLFFLVHPLLLVLTLFLMFKSKLKDGIKIPISLFLVISLLGCSAQFLPGAKLRFDYYPAFAMKAGVKYIVIPPSTKLENLRKNFLNSTELGKGTFVYELLGWQDSENLVYAQGPVNHVYHLPTQKENIIDNNSIGNLHKNICILKECLKNEVGYAGLINNWTAPVFVSPDGHKFAVVSEHLYGTQDIILIYK